MRLEGYDFVENAANGQKTPKMRFHLSVGGYPIGVSVKSLTDGFKDSDRIRYFHAGLLGNIALITDHNGKVIARQRYELYGERSQSFGDPLETGETKWGYTEHLTCGYVNIQEQP